MTGPGQPSAHTRGCQADDICLPRLLGSEAREATERRVTILTSVNGALLGRIIPRPWRGVKGEIIDS